MSWLNKILTFRINKANSNRKIEENLWTNCISCESILYKDDLKLNLYVCPKCSFHMKINVTDRINSILENENRLNIANNISSIDILKFTNNTKYKDHLKESIIKTGNSEALIVMSGFTSSIPIVLACFDFNFMFGSMGSAVGERFRLGVEYAISNMIPFVCIISSCGVRMQEGLFSLMQMAKTTAVLTKLSKAKLPYISILSDPTIGGVATSFAFLGDIVIAEPKASIGFTESKIISQTVKEKIPNEFQKSESLLQKGAIDMIIDRRNIKSKLIDLLSILLKN